LAALEVATGQVIGSLHRRHRWTEFRRFLTKLDKQVPHELAVHLVCDNDATHKTDTIGRWLAAHPRFQVHFVPTSSSWRNQVERFIAELTTKLLQRGVIPASTPGGRHLRLDPGLEPGPQAVCVGQDRRGDPRLPCQILPANFRRGTLVRPASDRRAASPWS
jgi:hypothetical protein